MQLVRICNDLADLRRVRGGGYPLAKENVIRRGGGRCLVRRVQDNPDRPVDLTTVTESRDHLDAEYRAFVKALHPETVGVIADFCAFWRPFYGMVLTGAESESDKVNARDQFNDSFEAVLRPRLLRLAYGHPDPDVREEAERLVVRMSGAYIAATRSFRDKSDNYRSVMLGNVQNSVEMLRRAIYNAPFRENQPESKYYGKDLPNTDPIPD